MNGIHDLGGMAGFGPIEPETDEPVFHAEWERRVFALTLAAGLSGNIDAGRHALEQIPPAQYLAASYYERWLIRLETVAVQKGLLTQAELATGTAANVSLATRSPLSPEAAQARVRTGTAFQRASGRQRAQFHVGDVVRARNLHPAGHTRLPRYVRGKTGVIEREHGTFVFPDANAHGQGEQPQPLYAVRFSARELWGDEADVRDTLTIDLWEDYLEAGSPDSVN